MVFEVVRPLLRAEQNFAYPFFKLNGGHRRCLYTFEVVRPPSLLWSGVGKIVRPLIMVQSAWGWCRPNVIVPKRSICTIIRVIGPSIREVILERALSGSTLNNGSIDLAIVQIDSTHQIRGGRVWCLRS